MSYTMIGGIVYHKKIGKSIFASDTCDHCALRAATGCELMRAHKTACLDASFYIKPKQDSDEVILAKLKGLTNA